MLHPMELFKAILSSYTQKNITFLAFCNRTCFTSWEFTAGSPFGCNWPVANIIGPNIWCGRRGPSTSALSLSSDLLIDCTAPANTARTHIDPHQTGSQLAFENKQTQPVFHWYVIQFAIGAIYCPAIGGDHIDKVEKHLDVVSGSGLCSHSVSGNI